MRIAPLLVALVLAGCATLQVPAGTPPPPAALDTLRVHYVDVGQGDGTVWQLGDGSIVVYDCGPPAPNAEDNPVVQKLRDIGLAPGARIRMLIASHGHLDHVGGCDEVLHEFAVDEIVEAWYDGNDRPESYARFLRAAQEEGARLRTLRDTSAGEVLFDVEGARATLIWPEDFAGDSWDEIAESSLVVRLTHGSSSFCFQVDIETSQEAKLARMPGDLSCDVLLVGHHGSRQASSAAWLARAQPAHGIASFGANSYGHPTSDALCRLQQAGATVYATHRAGTIVAESDGANVRVDAPRETLDYCAAGASYWPEG